MLLWCSRRSLRSRPSKFSRRRPRSRRRRRRSSECPRGTPGDSDRDVPPCSVRDPGTLPLQDGGEDGGAGGRACEGQRAGLVDLRSLQPRSHEAIHAVQAPAVPAGVQVEGHKREQALLVEDGQVPRHDQAPSTVPSGAGRSSRWPGMLLLCPMASTRGQRAHLLLVIGACSPYLPPCSHRPCPASELPSCCLPSVACLCGFICVCVVAVHRARDEHKGVTSRAVSVEPLNRCSKG